MQNINNKIELLAPAGSFDAMLAAVANGADAVYLGGNLFSARALATNFNLDEIVEAVKHCHLYNVKVYITVNVLYSDDLFEEIIEYIDFLYNHQVDALIIQDLGLLHVVKQRYPDFETHMSTQASVNDIEGVRFYEEKGVQRVVLARENTIDEISYICNNTPLDIEVFVHGALCMSYSGQCLFSSLVAKRSGNKGSCGQPCRLSYHLLKDHSVLSSNPLHLLSPKDLCSIDTIGQLLDAGVTSFKIEGRMKRPEYVASIVRQYRFAIDMHLKNKQFDTKEAIYEMKSMFNRGFTGGFIQQDQDFLAKEFPGHIGHKIGVVTSIDKRNNKITIQLSNTLRQQDRILFKNTNLTRTITKLYAGNQLVNHANKGDLIQIDMNDTIKQQDEVYLTYNYDLITKLQNTYNKNLIKFPISMIFKSDITNNSITLQLKYNDIVVEKTIEQIIEPAIKTSMTNERIAQQLGKLGDSIYYLDCPINIEFDNGYTVPIKHLNSIRRESIDLLNQKRLDIYQRKIVNVIDKPCNVLKKNNRIIVKVSTLEQMNCALQFDNVDVFCSIDMVLNFSSDIRSKINVYTSYFTTVEDITALKSLDLYKDIETVLVANYSVLNSIKDKDCILDRHFNIYNSYAIQSFKNNDIVMSIETTKKQLSKIHTQGNIYVYVYGHIETMHLKHCIISHHYFNKKIKNCNKCKDASFSISDRKKSCFRIIPDQNCNNIILHDRPIFIEDFTSLKCSGIILNFTIENNDETKAILDFYTNRSNHNSHQKFDLNLTTKGYLRD